MGLTLQCFVSDTKVTPHFCTRGPSQPTWAHTPGPGNTWVVAPTSKEALLLLKEALGTPLAHGVQSPHQSHRAEFGSFIQDA